MQLSHSLILVTESSNMAPHGKELSEDLKRRIVALHEDGQGYKKIVNTLKLSCSTVAKIIHRFKRAGSTQNRPRVGRLKKLSARAERHIQMLSLKDRRRSAVSIATEIEEVGGQPVSAQTIRRTLHQIDVHGCHPRRKPLLKTIHRKASKQFAEDMSTKYMDYWNHVLWSDEMKINLFGSDGFNHERRRSDEEYNDKYVMPTVKRGGENVIVWGCMSAAGVWGKHELQHVLWNTAAGHDLLPSETGSQGSLPAWQWPQTHFEDDHCFTEEVKVMDWPSMSPDMNPKNIFWGILKWNVEVGKVSNIRQLHDIIIRVRVCVIVMYGCVFLWSYPSIRNYNTYAHTHTPTCTHTLTTTHKRNPNGFLSVFFRIFDFRFIPSS